VSSTFSRFSPRLQAAIVARLGWSSLRPVQELAGEAILAGQNALILAPTAGGKTEAGFFPVLSSLMDEPPAAGAGTGVLYIAPIKALLNNQADRFGLYTEMVGLRRFVWHGDVADREKRVFLREPADVLLTTPESLEVMLISPRVDAERILGSVRAVIIDEIHALAGTDRGAHLMSVIERIASLVPGDLQRIGLSATVGNPEALSKWLGGSSRRPGVVVNPPRVPARRQLECIFRSEDRRLAHEAARLAHGQKSLFFCQTRKTAEGVAAEMQRVGTNVMVHHSAVAREERARVEEKFHSASDVCIVCTSTLELGIDVGDLDRVLQAEAPTTVGSFLQRMGRTGRRPGQTANTAFLCAASDSVVLAVAVVELARQGWVEAVPCVTRQWPVLVHQLLALALAESGVVPEAAWAVLSRVPDFSGVTRTEFDALIAYMVDDGGFRIASGRLVLGPKAEKKFGRRNFAELYSVFTSNQSYEVLTANTQPLGSLDQDFVDRLVSDVSCFLLAGRPWVVESIDHSLRRIVVSPAPRGAEPTWAGMLPQFLGFEICQKALEVLVGDTEYPWLDAEARGALTLRRNELEGVLRLGEGGIEYEPDEFRWWTFAGGRINTTLRRALGAMKPDWRIVTDNFVVKVRHETLTRSEFDEALDELRRPEIWADERFWAEVREMLPSYRLSKFQPLMPEWMQREMVAGFLLDVEGARRWMERAGAGWA
jgi:ATP-dependent Lhr-like helicase